MTGKCDEIERNKEEIVKQSRDLNVVVQSAVDVVNRGGGVQLVSAFGSIKNFFQSTVKIMDEITTKMNEINLTLGNVQSALNQVRQTLRS